VDKNAVNKVGTVRNNNNTKNVILVEMEKCSLKKKINRSGSNLANRIMSYSREIQS
jgi:hypothetical protein